MNIRLLAVGFWAALALFGGQAVPAQTARKAESIAVNELKARAVLAEGSIRFVLPLNAPAGAGERAVAWLLSPEGAASGETAIALGEGSRSVALTLPWPKDKLGHPATEIGWYRIAYRLETGGAPAAHGVLSVGAIASNLLALRLARPEQLVSGKPLSVRVYAGNPITREPYRGVRLQATLVLDAVDADADSETKAAKGKAAERSMVRAATTGAAGEAFINFPV
ncbi:MAG: hypothetical protein ABR898_16905, partial [Terracidiphilus sp.]